MAYKGKYTPKNPKKYIGNSNNIIYRSLWERTFMKYCDLNKNIIKWASEEIAIPYISPIDKKVHRYYPDFYIQYKNKENVLIGELIEVKPKKQTKPPKVKQKKNGKPTISYLREAKTYAVNEAKWKAASEFCKDRGWNFRILTEDQLT